MATYVNDLRLKEIATGDESGTWGTSTNTNLELIAEAFSYGTEAITTNADTHTTTIADGASDPGRALYLKYTGTLDSACTITIGPNTVSKVWIVENGTTGSQNIILSQGSGANITIPAGDTKVVYSDGAGAGAAFVDAFASLSVVDLTATGIVTAAGTSVFTNLDISGDIDVDGTTNLDVVDIDGAVDMASTLTVAGVLTGASLDISGDIDVDGTTNLDVVDIDGAVDMASTLTVGGDAVIASAVPRLILSETDVTNGNWDFRGSFGNLTIRSLNDDLSTAVTRMLISAGGNISFYEDTGTTAKMTWDAAATRLTLDGAETSRSSNTYLLDIDNSVQTSNLATSGPFRLKGYYGDSLTVSGAGDISFYDDSGAAKLFWDASAESLGLGTSAPAEKFTIDNGATLSANYIGFRASVATGGSCQIGMPAASQLSITTNSAERLRINATGKVLIGRATDFASLGYKLQVDFDGTTTGILVASDATASKTALYMSDKNVGGIAGTITFDGSAAQYNTSSDYRLKENIQPLANGLDRVQQLNPVQFDWITTGKTSEGFIAHEVQEVFAEAVSGEKDAEEMQGMDYGRITPLLVKAIQEQQTLIESLTARITTLEG